MPGRRDKVSWRRKSAGRFLALARAAEFFAPALLSVDDLLATNRQRFGSSRELAQWTQAAAEGLTPDERRLVPPRPRPKADAVVLGCGAGREALALAQAGWNVLGIDMIPELLAEARQAAERQGLSVEWSLQDLAQFFTLKHPADLICLFNVAYTYIPTRSRRVALLSECRKWITPGGRCLVTFAVHDPASKKRRLANRLRRCVAACVGGNRELEPGDYWYEGSVFLHHFGSLNEVAAEAAMAGWTLAPGRETWPAGHAVLLSE